LARIWNPNADPVTDSVSEMQRLAGALRQAVDVLGDQLDAGEPCEQCGRGRADLDSVHAVAWVRVLRELRTLLAEMERLGIASRGLEITEQLAGELGSAVRRVLDRLELDERQQGLVPVVVPEELRRITVEQLPAGLSADGGGA
jgi:plasmid stabilization system protein ParE